MQGFQTAAFLLDKENLQMNDQKKDNNTTSSELSNHSDDSQPGSAKKD